MKLRQVRINQFGHFTECELALPADGLQVIYGPNEAGKTTLLQFLRGWLFDFPARTPYDFKAGTEIAGVGTLILNDGRSVELRRRKGNKNKVSIRIDGQETGLDEVGFQRLIGNANRSLFESVFAFGLDQLSQGEESLKHESLQSALFGGGLGSSASPERILKELDRQAGELFIPIGKKPSINLLLTEMKELATQIKLKTLRSDNYRKYQQAAAEADALSTELHLSVDQLRREHGRLEKLCRAYPKWMELRQCRSDRLPLTIPGTLPIDARARYTSLSERIATSDEESARLANSMAGIERDLATLKLDPGAVSFRAEIRACLELKQSFLEAKSDLPKLTAEHESARLQIDRELLELRPGWTHEDLHAFVVDVATSAEIDDLIDQDRKRAVSLAKLRTKREQLSENLRQSQADEESLGELKDVAPLVAVLADAADYTSDRKDLDKRTVEAKKIERQLASQVKKLTPPLPPRSEAPQQLPVPRIETIHQFETDFADLRDQVRVELAALEKYEGELYEVREKLDEAVARGALPSLAERDDARRRRDENWFELRRLLMPEPGNVRPSADPKALSDSFEQTLREADEIADRIYANANAVIMREELGRQRDVLHGRITQKGERIILLKQQESELWQRWVAVWQNCGFEPLDPDAMLAWVKDHETVCETVAKREELLAESETLQQQMTKFEARLRVACETANGEIPDLLATAQQAVDDAKEQQRRSRELKRDIKLLKPKLEECDAELQELGLRESEWRDAWKSVLCRLRLPVEMNAELTRTVIGRLQATRIKLDSLPQEEKRLKAMQDRLEEFAARIRPVCEALAPDLLQDPPELAVAKLSDQLERAAEAQKKHDRLGEQQKTARDQRALVEDRLTKLKKDRAELFAAAEADSEAEFFDVVARAEKIRRLETELEQWQRDIDSIRAGDDREEFERLLAEAEPDVLDGQRRDLAERLKGAEQQERDAREAAGGAKGELARLDGSGEAAILTDELVRKRSHLAAEVDRYVPVVLARHLLSEAVRRFERENQPEMIATVSRLMAQMTAGRYPEFDRTTGATQGILVRRSDGAERTPDQLSTGTREQLYLAIRLAYVLHYCRQNEPLPIVMDDVLVNFDDDRARQTLSTLADVAQSVQILFFTCHPHMVALAKEAIPNLRHIDLPTALNNGAAGVA